MIAETTNMLALNGQTLHQFVTTSQFNPEVLLRHDLVYPRISVVMPSFNQAQFIERSILSVLNQNYANTEFIIVDGGSTDGTVQIIKNYQEYLTYWVSEPDRGQSQALNKGFAHASGDIFGWLNSDLPRTTCYTGYSHGLAPIHALGKSMKSL